VDSSRYSAFWTISVSSPRVPSPVRSAATTTSKGIPAAMRAFARPSLF
jgi:hypothetical protein